MEDTTSCRDGLQYDKDESFCIDNERFQAHSGQKS